MNFAILRKVEGICGHGSVRSLQTSGYKCTRHIKIFFGYFSQLPPAPNTTSNKKGPFFRSDSQQHKMAI